MADYFGELNNVEMSLLYYLEAQLAIDWTNVKLVNSFKQVTSENVPVICVELPSDESTRLEVGSDTAEDSTQRKALAHYIRDKIRVGCVYYTHALDVNKDLVRTAAGRLTMKKILTNAKIDFGDSVESADMYRHNLSFTVRKNY